MRLIDADKSLSCLPSDLPYKSSVRRVLMQAATVDAVLVVRCKDCVKRGAGDCPMERDCPWISTDSDAFCSYGERSEHGSQKSET